MKIVFFGTPQFAVPTLKMLIEHSTFEVVAVVTQPDKRRGRGGKTIPSAIKKIALECEIPVWQPKRVKKSQETLAQLRENGNYNYAYGSRLGYRRYATQRLYQN